MSATRSGSLLTPTVPYGVNEMNDVGREARTFNLIPFSLLPFALHSGFYLSFLGKVLASPPHGSSPYSRFHREVTVGRLTVGSGYEGNRGSAPPPRVSSLRSSLVVKRSGTRVMGETGPLKGIRNLLVNGEIVGPSLPTSLITLRSYCRYAYS